MRRIRFIASYPRSGNTWVRTFVFALLRETGTIPGDTPYRELGNYTPWDTSRAIFRRATGLLADGIPPARALSLRPAVHQWIAMNWPSPPIVKTHSMVGLFDGDPLFDFSIADRSIYLVRNPLDVIPSMARLLHITTERAVALAAQPGYLRPSVQRSAPELWGSWSENVRSWVDLPGVLVIRYEDLLASPLSVFSMITGSMGFAASPGQIEAAVKEADLPNMRHLAQSGSITVTGVRDGPPIGSGLGVPPQRKLAPNQIERICIDHSEMMARFGYLPAGGPTYS